MVNNCEIITKSAVETQEFGAKIAGDLEQGAVICLYGDLGSGKTTFMQGFANGLGIKQRILSPTFVLMRQYRIENCPPCREAGKLKIENLVHVDLYRINQEQETESLGLTDFWSDPKNIIAIEWPEKIEKLLPEKRINIHFEYLEDNKRKIIYETLY